MAVLQENPLSELLTFLDHVLSGFLLTRTKGDSGHTRVHTDFTTVLVPRGVGIGSRGEHENEGRHICRVTEASRQSEWWWVNIFLANLLDDKVLHGFSDSISSDGLEQDNLLEAVKAGAPVTGEDLVLRLRSIKNLLKLFVVLSEVFNNSLEGRQVSIHDKEHTVGLDPLEVT